MNRSFLRAAIVALFVPILLSSCDPGQKPVAKVGDRLITVADFQRAARGNEMQYSAVALEARAACLEDLMKSELLVQAAKSRGTDTTEAFRLMKSQMAERALLQSLYDRIAPPDVGVSEAEARELFSWGAQKADAQLVYLMDEATARAAQAALAAGQPFGEMAARFNVPGALPNNGNIGLITPGTLISPIDQALRDLPVGKPGGPYQTPQGWFFVLVKGREKAEQPPFETQLAAITERVRQRKRMMAMSQTLVALERSYRGKVTTGAPQLLFRFLTQFRVGGETPWTPSAAERAQTLATWDGGSYTFGNALDDLQNPELTKPQSALLPSIESWIHGMMRTRIAVAEAKRRHLHEDAQFERRIRAELDGFLAQGEYASATQSVPPPDLASVRAAWDQMKSNYEQIDRARVQSLTLADSSAVAAVARHGGHSGTLADAVRMADPTLPVKDEVIVFPSQDPEHMVLQGRLLRMAPGDWAGPEPVPGGWRILQLIDKVQGPREFEQLSPEIVQSVATNAFEMARNRHFEAYLDSLKTVFKPTPVPENLANIPWPVPEAFRVGR
ncbi:MAG: hypothetical protein IT348_04290 [Candidatus Eisenbacteria bacterium]|nr:hypothetical protein [Candidatus Eisenbacteria bacterium]